MNREYAVLDVPDRPSNITSGGGFPCRSQLSKAIRHSWRRIKTASLARAISCSVRKLGTSICRIGSNSIRSSEPRPDDRCIGTPFLLSASATPIRPETTLGQGKHTGRIGREGFKTHDVALGGKNLGKNAPGILILPREWLKCRHGNDAAASSPMYDH